MRLRLFNVTAADVWIFGTVLSSGWVRLWYMNQPGDGKLIVVV
jgi:hypothetical protein